MSQQPAERLRDMAGSLGYFIEEDFCELAGVKQVTAYEWRKRGHGPAHVRLGNRVLYERNAVRAFLQTLERTRPAPAAKDAL